MQRSLWGLATWWLQSSLRHQSVHLHRTSFTNATHFALQTLSKRKIMKSSDSLGYSVFDIQQKRSFSISKNTSQLCCERLSHRALVKMTGHDTYAFLQGLVTNDVHSLEASNTSSALYSMILNAQGRVLYDVILYKIQSSEPTVLLECNVDVSSELMSTFEKYKLRKKVKFSDLRGDLHVSAVFNEDLNPSSLDLSPLRFLNKEMVYFHDVDPRIKMFAHRIVTAANVKVEEVIDSCKRVAGVYDVNRYKIGLSEGTTDLPSGHCLPLESNLVFLNGVAFDKGCYVGQELTARTYHTGVIRKRLMPLILSSDKVKIKKDASVESASGKVCGKVKAVIGKYGLALLRLEEVVGKPQLTVMDGDAAVAEARTFIPSWWDVDSDAVLKPLTAKKQSHE